MDNEQRFHQHGQIGKVLDKFLDARLELHRPQFRGANSQSDFDLEGEAAK
jgi:hypothetical protein